MALVVEDGTGLSNANTYADVTYTDAYWLARNTATWAAATTPAKEAALLDAAQVLDYCFRWRGSRVKGTQAMSWPRAMYWLDGDDRTVSSTSVPGRVKDAQCILALESLANGDLLPRLDRGGRIQTQSVGPISVTYFADAVGSARWPRIDALLTDLIKSGMDEIVSDAVRG